MDISHFIHDLIEQLSAHPSWIFFAFFISSILSGLPILGSIIPVSLFQVGLASALADIHLNIAYLFFALTPGILLGDSCGFFCGRFFNHSLRRWRIIKKHQHLLDKSEVIFQKYGGITIIIGRVSGPLRTITPITAGIMEMRYAKFLCFDLIAAVLWFTTHIGGGYLAADPHLWQSLHVPIHKILML